VRGLSERTDRNMQTKSSNYSGSHMVTKAKKAIVQEHLSVLAKNRHAHLIPSNVIETLKAAGVRSRSIPIINPTLSSEPIGHIVTFDAFTAIVEAD
jgi:hypothetical protein